MPGLETTNVLDLREPDLDFVVNEVDPAAANKDRLKRLIREDQDFRKAMLGDDRLFRRVVGDDEAFVRISPALYFEILLRRALKDLGAATHTFEREGRASIPVFDSPRVAEFLDGPGVLEYLAQMLASFTRVRGYVVPVRVRCGVRRRVRYNDMDIDSLQRMCAEAAEEQRLGFYRRIADVCLFVSGVFPDHAVYDNRYAGSRQPRSTPASRHRRSLEDYEREGRRFYGLAAEHPSARAANLTDVLSLLRQHFAAARKPLTFIASQYLHSRKRQLFGVQA